MASPTLPTGTFSNAQNIYQSLLGFGLTPTAAAGVSGNIYQESHGISTDNGGLMGILGDTGGALAAEEKKVLAYIQQNGSIKDINQHATSVTAATDYFEKQYERAGVPAIGNRENAALWTAAQANAKGWSTTASLTAANINIPLPGGIPLPSIPNPVSGAANDVVNGLFSAILKAFGVSSFKDMAQRLGIIIFGVILVIVGIHMLGSTANKAQSYIPSLPERSSDNGDGDEVAEQHTTTRPIESESGGTERVTTSQRRGITTEKTERRTPGKHPGTHERHVTTRKSKSALGTVAKTAAEMAK